MKQQIIHLKFHSVQNNNMAKTSCEFNTSEQSTKAWFRTKGLIDTFNRILNLNEFRKQNAKWSNYARIKFNTNGPLFFEISGKTAQPNTEAFNTIDGSKSMEFVFNELEGTPIKTGVEEVFQSNPELSSIGTPEEYSQYLESLNKPNTNPILQGNQANIEEIITQLEKEGLLEIDCKGKLKAEKGLATSFVKGGEWKVIKDLKGYPTHKEGGVDLTIGKGGVSIKNGNTQFTAKYGLVIPKN